jgi:hypothetical protein
MAGTGTISNKKIENASSLQKIGEYSELKGKDNSHAESELGKKRQREMQQDRMKQIMDSDSDDEVKNKQTKRRKMSSEESAEPAVEEDYKSPSSGDEECYKPGAGKGL